MKPQFLIAFGVIFLVVAVATLVAILLVEEDRFGDVILATAIETETNAPVDEVTDFEEGVEAVFATLEVRDLDAGATFEFLWQGEGDDEPIETQFSLTEDIDDETWVYGALINDEGLPAGEYSVEVRHDGDLIERKEFSVTAE